jgi:hypothetical protein
MKSVNEIVPSGAASPTTMILRKNGAASNNGAMTGNKASETNRQEARLSRRIAS